MRSRGLSLLEYLMALLVCSVALAGTMSLLSGAHTALAASKREEQSANTRAVFSSVILHIARASDEHPLPIRPQIHESTIKFTSGAPHPLASSAAHHQAISWLEVDFLQLMRLERHEPQPRGCSVFGRRLELPNYELMIGVGLRGATLYELLGQSIHSPTCRSFRLRAIESTVLPSIPFTPQELVFLIPVRRENVVFRDGSGTVRWAAVVGERILENAPLLDQINSMEWQLHDAAGGGTFQITARAALESNQTIVVSILDQLGSIHWMDLLLRY